MRSRWLAGWGSVVGWPVLAGSPRPGDEGSSWLHVSAGLGTSPYARIRVACRPEATLLTLLPPD